MDERATHRPARGHVLVADDEPHIRRILTTLLESAGFVVEPAADGDAVVALLLDPGVPCDLLLTDLMMPGRDGLEVLRAVGAMPHRAGLVTMVMSGKGDDADRNAALQLGASDFLTKPFSPRRLLDRVEELLRADPQG